MMSGEYVNVEILVRVLEGCKFANDNGGFESGYNDALALAQHFVESVATDKIHLEDYDYNIDKALARYEQLEKGEQ